MISGWLVFVGAAAVFTLQARSCQTNEFTLSDGQCCPTCNEGMKVTEDCMIDSGTRCGPCETGTFMNKPSGLKYCFPCTVCHLGDGLFVKEECKKTSDTVCEALTGYFCRSYSDDTGCSLADKHSSCKSGQRIKEAGTTRNDTVCEDCRQGYFSSDGVNCTLWTNT
ncbi:tumor necrosis factor receptor superfamily member 14-like isoform X2 [Cololabis saira]|uniref:tumor necrosis factor receptor superfamily member 14-like isoform X2 n=1 Tax=Cololabis saira TaxID=129043 RepID=UPI002AD45EE8|nr:tumor necrosis factor receptor superfamily member 14-like isoform X2 [Cololabis saira]